MNLDDFSKRRQLTEVVSNPSLIFSLDYSSNEVDFFCKLSKSKMQHKLMKSIEQINKKGLKTWYEWIIRGIFLPLVNCWITEFTAIESDSQFRIVAFQTRLRITLIFCSTSSSLSISIFIENAFLRKHLLMHSERGKDDFIDMLNWMPIWRKIIFKRLLFLALLSGAIPFSKQ